MDNEVVIHVRVDKNMAASDMEASKKTIVAGAGKAGDEAGKVLGDNLLKGADGKLRDSKGRFASIGSGIGRFLGDSAGKGLAGGIMDGISALKGQSTPILVGVIAAASPMIGAAISTAIIGGAGGLGLIGGVALAARSPQISNAGRSMGENLMAGLEEAAGKNFTGPIFRSIDMIETGFERLRPVIGRIFSNTAPFLEPLVGSTMRAVGSILSGIERLTSEGNPVMESLGRTVEIVGIAFEKASDIIAGGSEEAANANDQMAESLGSLIIVAAGVVRGLTEIASVVVDVNAAIDGGVTSFGKFLGIIDETGNKSQWVEPQLEAVAGSILSTAEAAGEAGQAMSTYGDKMEDAGSKGQGFFDAQTNVAKAIRSAEKALKENGKGLGTNTEKQLDNRDALSKVAGELRKTYSGFVKLNGEGAASAGVAESNRKAFIKLATQFTGSRRAAEQLADQMGLLKPKKIEFYANTHDAAGRIAALKGQIASVKGKTVTITTRVLKVNAGGDEALHGYRAHGGIVGAAAGGNRSGMTMVGEYGPELVELPPGTRVNSNADTQRMMGSGMGGGGDGRPIIVQLMLDGQKVAEATIEPMRGLIRKYGSGSAQRYYGQAGVMA